MKIVTYLAAALLATAACGKKDPKAGDGGAPGTAAGSGVGSGPGATNGSGAVAPEPTGQIVAGCPKELRGSDADKSYTITKECGPVPVVGEYYLDNGTLTLEAGAQLVFQENGRLGIGYSQPAKLIVKGTAEAPVRFTTSADKVPGVWKGVRLHQGAKRSSIEGLVIEYAGEETEGEGAIRVDATDVTIKGSTVKGTKGAGLVLTLDGRTEVSGMTFEGIGKAAIFTAPDALVLGPGNKFPAGAMIHVEGRAMNKSATWTAQGATYFVSGELYTEAESGSKVTLEIGPGVQVKMGPAASITVGYHGAGALKAVGTKEAPVTFTGEDWRFLRGYQESDLTLENVVIEGSTDEGGAVWISNRGSVKSSTLRNNAVGIFVDFEAKLSPDSLEGNTFQGHKKAAIFLAMIKDLATVGAGNKFADKERLMTNGRDVAGSATWHGLGAPVEVLEDFSLGEKTIITIEPGARFELKDGVTISVGYGNASGLRAVGTAEKPITFAGIRDEEGVWDGIHIYEGARDVALEHVVLRNVRNEKAAIVVDDQAVVKLTNVGCAKCEAPAVVSTGCKSKLTAANLVADPGKKTELKPEGCE
jgi:hypothetical protein